MSDPKLNYLAALRASGEALRSLHRQLLYLEEEARELDLEIVSHLIGAAVEEVNERLAQHEAKSRETSRQLAALETGSTLRH